jgi:putative endonuclease
MEYSVYILKNDNGKIYIGQTTNVSKRLIEHNETGKGYTSKYRPWKVIHVDKFLSRKDAMVREKYLKTGAGRDWINQKIMRA